MVFAVYGFGNITFLAVIVGSGLVPRKSPSVAASVDVAVFGLLAGVILLNVANFLLTRRAGRYVRSMRRFAGSDDTGCRLCPKCMYDLRASEPIGACPESNMPYTSESLENTWTQRFPLSHVR